MKQLILFLLINFGGLALGSFLMGNPAENEWYQSLDKAPWTPPGWVFGAAWFSIMLFYSIFMQQLLKTKSDNSKSIKWLFGLSVFFNVCWNPIFFVHHYVVIGLVFLIALFILLIQLFRISLQHQSKIALLLLPYLIWMLIAISLNAYVL
ncbi:MAG: TspO/MBR family protein [Moraxellaceae bacterium]|jgi:benzodiazapine receptor